VKLYALLIQALAYLAAVVLGAMALLVTVDVVLRNVAAGGLPWVNEVSEYSLPVATLLVAPWLLRRNEHVRLDVLLTSLPKGLSRALERAAELFGIAICAVLVWYSLRLIADSMRLGSMVVKTLTVPEWWQYALVPVCFVLLAVEFARRLRA
jgi:TRAP-type transport system small permease protein